MMDFGITVKDGNILLDEHAVQVIKQAKELELAMKAAEIKVKQVRQAVMNAMEQNGIKKFENDDVEILYVAATTKKGVDVQKLKDEGVYEKYCKTSPVKASVRVTYKYDD